jgi:hypothetical protein
MIATTVLPDMPPPAPRRFQLRAVDATARFQLLFGAIWMFVGGFIGVIFTITGGPFWDDVLLDQRGVTVRAATGTIEPTSSSLNHRRVHLVRYTFTDATGVQRAGSGRTTDPAAFYGVPGVEIDYDPRSPDRSRVHGESASLMGGFILLPVAFFVAGSIVLAFGLRRVRAVRAIYVHGQAVPAQVTRITPTRMRINRRPVMRVDYAFDTIMGRATGSTTALNPPGVGGMLWVLHLPSEPKRNVAA